MLGRAPTKARGRGFLLTHLTAIEETKGMKRIIRAVVMALLLAASFSWAEEKIRPYYAGVEAYEVGDYETAYEIFLPFAEGGLVRAQYSLGYMYYYGLGVVRDYPQAIHWYREAAEKGDSSAQFNLGSMYYHGQGVEQNLVLAHMWISIAGAISLDVPLGSDQQGYPNARNELASIMPPEAIAESQRRARICIESDYQDCD